MFKNTLDNKRYYTLNYFFKMKFGQKVFKVPLDINSTCPNQINGGCIYCSNKSSATISNNVLDILEQFENGRKIMEQKWPDSLYIPYFQSGTNTYNDKNLVKNYVDKLLGLPKVVGIDIPIFDSYNLKMFPNPSIYAGFFKKIKLRTCF